VIEVDGKLCYDKLQEFESNVLRRLFGPGTVEITEQCRMISKIYQLQNR
jgi:hypothetical protein